MAITETGVAWGGTQSGVTNTSLAMTAQTVNVGDFVVLGTVVRTATAATGFAPTSSLGNSYLSLGTISETPALINEFTLWAGFVTTGGTDTITWNWTNAGAAVATGTRWLGVGGTSGSTALDVAATTNGATTGTAITSTASASTVTAGDLVIAAYGFGGPATNTLSAQAFTPAGTSFNVPDTIFQSTGTDGCTIQLSETLSGAAGNAQNFAATINASVAWGCILACFKPAAVVAATVATAFIGNQGGEVSGTCFT